MEISIFLLAIGLLVQTLPCLLASDVSDKANLMFFNGKTFDENEIYSFNNSLTIFQHEKYDQNKKTVLYLHGYLEGPTNESIHLIVDSYLQRNDHNIIVLDWSLLVAGDYVLSAVPNAIAMGKSVGRLLQNWFTQGLNIDRFHLVGHSLGGQLAGMVGRNIILDTNKEIKLRRISGLDPANPPFFPALLTLALGKSDADFVDIIHTDAGLYGAPISTGTVDFWPNGGTTLQPGCPTRNFQPLTDNDLCSHRRSWRFWAESVSSPPAQAFPAVKAENLPFFKMGLVQHENTIAMGIDCPTNATEGKYFLQTNAELPFSKGIDGTYYRM